MRNELIRLLSEIKTCQICADVLPVEPRPVLQVDAQARILLAGQAPGSKVFESGVPFADASGQRLRAWLGIDETIFYDAGKIAILPMGFCYPGKAKSGDLAPRQECAAHWRHRILEQMSAIQLTILIGQYALNWHLADRKQGNLTETVKNWQSYWPEIIVLPHPSPRNNIWLKKNPWFDTDVVPALRQQVKQVLNFAEVGVKTS